MDEIHIHCEPIDCPKCADGKMVPTLGSEVYQSKHGDAVGRGTEFSHRPQMAWKCVNCGHEIVQGQKLPQAHCGLTKTGDTQ